MAADSPAAVWRGFFFEENCAFPPEAYFSFVRKVCKSTLKGADAALENPHGFCLVTHR